MNINHIDNRADRFISIDADDSVFVFVSGFDVVAVDINKK